MVNVRFPAILLIICAFSLNTGAKIEKILQCATCTAEAPRAERHEMKIFSIFALRFSGKHAKCTRIKGFAGAAQKGGSVNALQA
jgi:hypothetical protein